MNKTLMLVICDFLLLSMLALARFDPPAEKAEPALDATASSATAEAELIELLEESLQAEQGSRENLSSDLQATREDLQDKARRLEEREAALAETLANLEKTSAEAEALARAKAEAEKTKAELAAEREALAQRFETTREELQKASEERIRLADTLGSTREARSLSDERLKQTEETLRQREAQLAQREAELRAAQEERERLAQQQAEMSKALEVAQTERRLLSETLTKEQREKQEAFARAERLGDNVGLLGQGVSELGLGVNRLGTSVDQIGTGVSQLGQEVSTVARSSEAIQKEIEASRPQTMSEIFTRFQKNRATVRFTSREQGLFGGSVERSYESRSILVNGADDNVYLVTHSNNSPFTLSRSSRVESVTLTVATEAGQIQIRQIGFLAADPRLIFIPLPKSFVANSGLETFPLALQPERWEEAVLVKNDESNFGRTEFRRLTSSAGFLRMERPALGELFADFAASRGDLAFTKNSQFIGLLTDTRHAVVIEDFVAGAILNLGERFEPETARNTIEQLRARLRQLPSEVQ
ncbi:MAG: hypothetical protein ACNA77_08895 [Opitutales bacterium]